MPSERTTGVAPLNDTRAPQAHQPTRPAMWGRLRIAAALAWAALVVAIVVENGVPTGRAEIAGLIMSGLALTSIGRGWRQTGKVLLDWLPFSLVLILYDSTRSVVDSLGVPLHEADVLHAETWLFGGVEPTVWLQQHLYDPGHVHWYDALCTIVYSSHFLVTPVLAACLWLANRRVWIRYISRVVAVSVAGLLTYCVFPEAPPWLAAQDALTTAVPRLSARGWTWLHLGGAQTTLSSAQNEGANPVAAMPSLHTALAVLAAIFVITRLRSRWRWLVALYPVAMGFTLVYCGEHYVIDLLAGVAYAFATHAAVSAWERRRNRRAGHRGESVGRDAPDAERIPAPAQASSGVVPAGSCGPGPDDSADPGEKGADSGS